MDLSILIPARNELFLSRTVEDILVKMRGDTEIIVVLDGALANPPLPVHPKVSVIHHSESIGQRAATNEAARMSQSKYLMKVDAHCSFDEGFDVKLIADMQDDWTMVPIMRNLHAFDWVCDKCGDRRYQGPTPTSCPTCDNKDKFTRDIKWIGKTNPQSTSYCFDSEPHFQYFNEFKRRPEAAGKLTDTMSLQGSCFVVTREKYFELNLCDEEFGSWGSQGIEVAVKTWLSGGRVVVNHNTWYAHMFRTQGGDFGFPYNISGNQVARAKKTAKDIFFNNKWPMQKYPLSWLLEKFWPVPGWSEEQLNDMKKVGSQKFPEHVKDSHFYTKGIVFYTDNQCDPSILTAVVKQLSSVAEEKDIKVVSVSLKPFDFGKNIVLELERGYITMFRQILAGLEALDTDIAFLAEHDVIYHKSHFDFFPSRSQVYYYNQNVWQIRATDGFAVYWDCKRQSQLCGYTKFLIEHYRKRIELCEEVGFSRRMGFEPGTHNRPERVDDFKAEGWNSEFPSLDIRHDKNLTSSRWSTTQFRSQRNCRNWKESHLSKIPGWEGLKL